MNDNVNTHDKVESAEIKTHKTTGVSSTDAPQKKKIEHSDTVNRTKKIARRKKSCAKKEDVEKKSIKADKILGNKKLQLTLAIVLTLIILVGYPTYSWFKFQRSIERFEKISTPNSLYITSARREDSKYIEIDNVDVSAYWYKADGTRDVKATYQDYVFSVAGDYVTSYTLQLAHTTNNNYTYTIYEADVTNVDPSTVDASKCVGKDYVEYTLSDKYDPAVLAEIDPNNYAGLTAGQKLYYSVKLDDDGDPISLDAVDRTIANKSSLIASTYTVKGKTVSYKGHYLNWASQFAALGSGTYHNATYGSDATVGNGSGTNVQTHAEPLYWQANEIPVDGAVSRKPFYHEYILRISWTNGSGANDASAEYKDTDIIYITVKAD